MMILKNEQIYQGFRVISARYSQELNSSCYTLIHEKTGARLFWLDNGEENKVFSIAFRTLPSDDSGVFHILEHSVLCGSERYPVHEPFVELMKSSMNTFLNAITFQDMTMYPVASRNNKDLLNLATVYLDAVFRPAIQNNQLIFYQEGWHIEKDENGQYQYKGVVLNEMKGAMNDTDTINDQTVLSQLFPDNGYGCNSGGDPACITDLSYSQFLNTYRKHYHPSNAYVYLDGDVPFDEILTLLNSYFNLYDKCDDQPVFSIQKPKSDERTIAYEIGKDENTDNKGHLSVSRLLGLWNEKEKNLAAGIIGDVLTGNNEAPLKREILKDRLAQDINISVDDSGFQSWYSIHAENITDGKETEILERIRLCGESIRRDGLDSDALEASLNRMAYCLKEKDEPQGINRCIRSMGSWLYDGDPLFALENDIQVNHLREMIYDGRISELAASMLLNTEGLCILHMYPSKELGDIRRQEESEKLIRITNAWTEEDHCANNERISRLREWQETEDTPEQKNTLPMLTRKDADVRAEWTGTEESYIEGVRVLYHHVYCSGIVHLRVYFSLTDCSLEELTKIDLMCGMLGKLPTRKHDAFRLQQEIKKYTGKLGFSVAVRGNRQNSDLCTPYIIGATSVLEQNLKKAEELLCEILTETRFDVEDRIIEIVQQNEMSARQKVAGSGHIIAVRNVLSHYSADQAVRNALDGDDSIRYIHAFSKDPQREMPHFLSIVRHVMSDAICKKRMTISITADAMPDIGNVIHAFLEGKETPEYQRYSVEKPLRSGYCIPAQIGFAARGYRLDQCGMIFNGTMWLVGNILSLSYLWNKVRVQGGAYGAGFQIDRLGNIFTYSFRDPTPYKSLDADLGIVDFLNTFCAEKEELDKYIISSLNELNPLLSAKEKGALADARFMSEYKEEDAERTRQEILNAEYEDLICSAKWLKKFVEEGSTCVVGYSDTFINHDDTDVDDL